MILQPGVDYMINNVHESHRKKAKDVIEAIPLEIIVKPEERPSFVNAFLSKGINFGLATLLIFPSINEYLDWNDKRVKELSARYSTVKKKEGILYVYDSFEDLRLEVHPKISAYLAASLN